jgi:hypothetical protein
MDEIEKVRDYMKYKYQVDLADLEISDVPGYWRDKVPKMHPRHPIHQLIGCRGPFKATYTYFDNPRDYSVEDQYGDLNNMLKGVTK